MMQAESAVQPPLVNFYDLLDDEQEARLNALAEDRRKMSAANGATEAPAQAMRRGATSRVAMAGGRDRGQAAPERHQRAALKALQDANARAVGILSAECQPEDATTHPLALTQWTGGSLPCSKRSIW